MKLGDIKNEEFEDKSYVEQLAKRLREIFPLFKEYAEIKMKLEELGWRVEIDKEKEKLKIHKEVTYEI